MAKNKTISWGVVGSSSVTRQFCTQLLKVPEAKIRHVCSRRLENSQKFAEKFGVGCYSNEMQTLIDDESIDVVYLSSPTRLHAEQILSCIKTGKAVLCEKPIATSSKDIEEIILHAKNRDVFCMEAMWTRFNPLVNLLKKLIENGDLGDIVTVRAEIGYKKDRDRLSDPARGALWDFSVYGLSLFHYLFGEPDSLTCPVNSYFGTGITCAAVFQWKSGTFGSLTATIDANLPNQLSISGTKGNIILGPSFMCPSVLKSSIPLFNGSRILAKIGDMMSLFTGKNSLPGPCTQIADPMSGFFHEALEVHEALRANKRESLIMPLSDSLAVVQLAEEIQKYGGGHAEQP